MGCTGGGFGQRSGAIVGCGCGFLSLRCVSRHARPRCRSCHRSPHERVPTRVFIRLHGSCVARSLLEGAKAAERIGEARSGRHRRASESEPSLGHAPAHGARCYLGGLVGDGGRRPALLLLSCEDLAAALGELDQVVDVVVIVPPAGLAALAARAVARAALPSGCTLLGAVHGSQGLGAWGAPAGARFVQREFGSALTRGAETNRRR